jgi:hypothetical protein
MLHDDREGSHPAPPATLVQQVWLTCVVRAVCTRCRGVNIWEPPPPTQGVAALVGLNLLEADEQLTQEAVGGAAWLHSAIESMRLAFADVLAVNAGATRGRAGESPSLIAVRDGAGCLWGGCHRLHKELRLVWVGA